MWHQYVNGRAVSKYVIRTVEGLSNDHDVFERHWIRHVIRRVEVPSMVECWPIAGVGTRAGRTVRHNPSTEGEHRHPNSLRPFGPSMRRGRSTPGTSGHHLASGSAPVCSGGSRHWSDSKYPSSTGAQYRLGSMKKPGERSPGSGQHLVMVPSHVGRLPEEVSLGQSQLRPASL